MHILKRTYEDQRERILITVKWAVISRNSGFLIKMSTRDPKKIIRLLMKMFSTFLQWILIIFGVLKRRGLDLLKAVLTKGIAR